MKIVKILLFFVAAAAAVAHANAQQSASGDQPAVGAGNANERSVPQVRIVRLSQTKGMVDLDRGTGAGFELGFMNLPIVEGARLRTGQESWAEVEFENNSSLRITPDSQVEFTRLGRDASGDLITRVKLVRGTLYVSLAKYKEGSGSFFVNAEGKTVTLPPSSHIRLDLYPSGSELVVVKGIVKVEDPPAVWMVDKSKALTFGNSEIPKVVSSNSEAPGLYDQWDAASVKYHEFQASGAGYQYGAHDLQTYGSFADFGPGCGQLWQPYFTSAAWNPYANGVWAWYPGAGYSWVSMYPWGWTPYHSGEWVSCGANGWGWRPGGSFVGLKNTQLFKPVPGPKPIHPIRPPGSFSRSLIVVNQLPLTSSAGVGHSFFFAKDSAGLGIPRDGFDKLNKISFAVETRGDGDAPVSRDHLDRASSDARVAFMALQENRAISSNLRAEGAKNSLAGPLTTSRPVALSESARTGGYSGGSSGFLAAHSAGYSGAVSNSSMSHASPASYSAAGSPVGSSVSAVSSSSAAGASSGGGSHH
jgi:hypothetical protein